MPPPIRGRELRATPDAHPLVHRLGQGRVPGDVQDTGAKRLVRTLPLVGRPARPVRHVVEVATAVVGSIGEPTARVTLEVGEPDSGPVDRRRAPGNTTPQA